MKPEFICIGAQKAGTTWLYSNLEIQPGFSLPPVKEIHYFDRAESYPSPNILSETSGLKRLCNSNYCRTAFKKIYGSLRSESITRALWWARYSFSSYSDSWYRSLFNLERGVTGDITPSYSILDERDIGRMHTTAPDAKIVFLIRNPIDRAWSHFRFTDRQGNNLDLKNFEAFRSFIDSPVQELRSDYLRTIDAFSKFYNSENILIGFYDAILRDQQGLLNAIVKHIGGKLPINGERLNKVVNQSQPVDIPVSFHAYLKEKYQSNLEALSVRYGSYAREWYSDLIGGKVEKSGDGLSPVVHA